MSVRTPAELRNRDKTHLAAFASVTYTVNDWEWGAGLRIDEWENKTVNRDAQIANEQGDTEIMPPVVPHTMALRGGDALWLGRLGLRAGRVST